MDEDRIWGFTYYQIFTDIFINRFRIWTVFTHSVGFNVGVGAQGLTSAETFFHVGQRLMRHAYSYPPTCNICSHVDDVNICFL